MTDEATQRAIDNLTELMQEQADRHAAERAEQADLDDAEYAECKEQGIAHLLIDETPRTAQERRDQKAEASVAAKIADQDEAEQDAQALRDADLLDEDTNATSWSTGNVKGNIDDPYDFDDPGPTYFSVPQDEF